MGDVLVRLWDDCFTQSVCGFVDWRDGLFTVPPLSPIAKGLVDRAHRHLTVFSEPDDKHWIVTCWSRSASEVRVESVSARKMLSDSLLPDWMVSQNTTGRWKVFREKVPLSMSPMWVVWDEYGEFFFKTGAEALNFVDQELSRRHWAGMLDNRRIDLV